MNRSTFTGTARYHVRTHQTAAIGDDYFRCCAKIAFNTLAHLKGKDLVLQECFNPIRDWIVKGGDNRFVDIAPSLSSDMKHLFPQDSHYVLITQARESLIADVCFYNHFHNVVRLTDHCPDRFHLEGFVCDWQVKKEFDFHDYLAQRLVAEKPPHESP